MVGAPVAGALVASAPTWAAAPCGMTVTLVAPIVYPLSSRLRAVSPIVTTAPSASTTCSSNAFCLAVGAARTVCSTTMLGTASRCSSGTTSCPSGPG